MARLPARSIIQRGTDHFQQRIRDIEEHAVCIRGFAPAAVFGVFQTEAYASAEKARGLHRHRVRLLHDPPHAYERYECEWGYVFTGGAGEDIRVLDPADHRLPAELVDHDYWLLDDVRAVRMHYAEGGAFLGATVEPDLIEAYRAGRDAAWRLAEPFNTWWNRHPEHHRDNDGKAA